MIEEYEDPWGAHQGVPKVQKRQKMVCGRAILGPCLTILGHSFGFLMFFPLQIIGNCFANMLKCSHLI